MSEEKHCDGARCHSITPPSSVAGAARAPASAAPTCTTTALESIAFAWDPPPPHMRSKRDEKTQHEGASPMKSEQQSSEDCSISEEAALSPPVGKPAAKPSVSANTTNEVNESGDAIESSSSEVAADVKANVPEFVPPQEPSPNALLHSNSGAFTLRPSATAAAPETTIALGHRHSSSFVAAVTEQRSELSQPRVAADTIPSGAGAPSGQTAGREGVGGLGTPGAVHVGGHGQSGLQSSLGSAGGSIAAQSPQDYVATAAVVDDSGWEEEVQRLERQNEALADENEMLRRARMATAEAVEVCIEPVSGGQPPRDNEQGGEEGDAGEGVAERTFGKKIRDFLLDRRSKAALLLIGMAGLAIAVVAASGKFGGNSNDRAPDTELAAKTSLPTHKPSHQTATPTKSTTLKPTIEPTKPPTLIPTRKNLQPTLNSLVISLKSKICSDLPSTCADLSTEGTPQSKALAWLALDSKFEEYDEWRRIQRYVLATVAYSLEGWGTGDVVDWTDGPEDECAWNWGTDIFGNKIECNAVGQITQIAFDYSLVGQSIPRDLALLSSSLEELNFCCVDFKGSIPTQIGMLTNLQFFDLGYNELSGAVPTEVGLLTNLKWLYLYNNRLSGQVPSELGNLSQLETLNLRTNDITGTMPEEVCQLRTPGSTLWELYADCKEEVQCDCCTYCCDVNGNCDFV